MRGETKNTGITAGARCTRTSSGHRRGGKNRNEYCKEKSFHVHLHLTARNSREAKQLEISTDEFLSNFLASRHQHEK
jgi:hypothetical protein